jgi:hypothetical protein
MTTKFFLGDKERPVREADNLAVICGPIILDISRTYGLPRHVAGLTLFLLLHIQEYITLIILREFHENYVSQWISRNFPHISQASQRPVFHFVLNVPPIFNIIIHNDKIY